MKQIFIVAGLALSLHGAEKNHIDLSSLETPRLILRYSTTQDRQVFKEIATSDDAVCQHLFGKSVNQEQMIKTV